LQEPSETYKYTFGAECKILVCGRKWYIPLSLSFDIAYLISLHESSNDNGVRLVNFATSKNLRVKSTMFPNRNFHKCTWTSPDGETHNQIDHILVDRRRHSNVLDVRSFRAADCDSDHYLVVAKVRERLAVNKQRSHKFDVERFNLKKLNDVESKEQFRVEVSNRFADF
jgi:hypothetical protein